ncbi:MAG: hypothetical protein KC561_12125, partial [Myxococcales bacterium]|nr:hypothetical protein [Myxococcales bacterium]
MTVHAQRAARVFLVTFEGLGDVPDVAVSQINQALVERMEGVRNLDVQTRARTAEAGSQGGTVNAAIDQAQSAYQAGIGLYVVEDFNGASARFEEMMNLFEQNIAEVRNWDVLADGMLRWSESRLRLGDTAGASELLHRLFVIRPSHSVDADAVS